ncbi:PREDICTED: dynein heavy chain 17, axonemal-like, partial [Pterocles gutturalis]|uniref:dynein heavy chain 17, axonemal-like n=1 Tax=Pterocles gutturalis TaxID=240206 RepID=UPI0005280A58
VKCVLDAIRAKKTKFNFLGETITLVPSVGLFITMNPGYAGRTELPENLKALFRPCAMVVPDFELICEIMLVAEGFIDAKLLARKFITLYTLCKELLSKQDHYDWGLRAIKSVLVVAGSLKRGDPGRPEDQVLMRALRDFNIPKIVTDDLPVFMGLIGDLFPALDVLTLASNERIPLNPTMRLLFEISHLRTATPATVIVTSWIETRTVQSEKAHLMILFDKYLPVCLEKLKSGFKRITPVPKVTVIQTVLYLLDCLLTPQTVPPESPRELYELYFVFACTWAFGSAMFQDQLVDYRVEFSKWWVNEFKTIKFPAQGTIFDYFIDPETKKFLPWTEKVPSFELDPDMPLQASLVHTAETIRLRYFVDMLMEKQRPVMLVGNAGTGKSVLMRDKLETLSTDQYLVQSMPFNFYTTSAMLQ